MGQVPPHSLQIAVILPCLDEAAAIGGVIADFRAALPEARIVVVDNGSTDDTAALAAAAGATVLVEGARGKGNAVRRAFAAIDSDIYVIADGDGTYDASAAGALVKCLVDEHLDMVIGSRRKLSDQAFRARHEWGNRFFNRLLHRLFGSTFTDIFSGYRVFSRRYVRSFPSSSKGFEIETEMTMHALLLRMPVKEIPCDYRARPAGSASKLNTWRDGFRIFWAIGNFFRKYRPLAYFNILAAVVMTTGLGLFLPIVNTYLQTGLVPRVPTLIVAIGLGIVGILFAMIGILLDAIAASSLDTHRLLYLNADRRK